MTHGTLSFLKAHGAGNDFLLLDEALGPVPSDFSRLAPSLCCRRTGVGADGILVIRQQQIPFMECWNADGSQAEACGNGLRIVALALQDRHPGSIRIATDAGTVEVQLLHDRPGEFSAEASLGQATVGIPTSCQVDGTFLMMTPVNLGNPHLVVAIDPESLPDPLSRFGPGLENSVPGRANVGFVRIDSPQHLTMRVWERGCGETQACGSAAAAAFAALRQAGFIDDKIEVQMPGGVLGVRIDDETGILVRGPARISYRGVLSLDDLALGSDRGDPGELVQH
ncbi:MAG: diaminopimelate epimerase [Planctomycetota bacterium]|nr:diaminopimelate epimerase [Planctomycetota bacterium]